MDLIPKFLWILLGVVVSIILPLVWKWATLPTDRKREGMGAYLNSAYKPYLLAGIAAIIISAFLLIFATNLENPEGAATLGFGWQSFLKNLQKSE